jgi:hypothetical protein
LSFLEADRSFNFSYFREKEDIDHMKRRDFIISTSVISLGSMSLGIEACKPDNSILIAGDMQEYLRRLHEVSEPSVDRIVIGDPETRIIKVGTCWQPYFSTLRRAKELGVNLLIVHEPTFYTHWDLDTEPAMFQSSPSPARENYRKAIEEKKNLDRGECNGDHQEP